MATLVKDLIESGIHFGQRRSNWNPKMAPYIFGVRNRIHIIDIRQTIKGLLAAKRFVTRTVASGRDVCFVDGPAEVLDHASARFTAGTKMGIDATVKWKEEGFDREWPAVARMSPEVKALVDGRWEEYGLD